MIGFLDRADVDLPAATRVGRAVVRWLKLAVYLAGIFLVLYVVSGGEVLTKYGAGVTLERVLVLYVVGCLIAGMIAGALTPLSRTLLGSVVAIWFCLLPVGLLIGMAFRGLELLDPILLLGAAVFAISLGTIYGAIDWHYRPRP